jgi:endonuclease/exonuclease/phosphatase family metal-dependent hydrolase
VQVAPPTFVPQLGTLGAARGGDVHQPDDARRPPAPDGPGIRRTMRTVAQLEAAHPELEGRLDPPAAAAPPAGIDARVDHDGGLRVLTLNVHQGVPGGVDMTGSNESIDALRDVAAYVNSVDPDVVLVQELTSHPDGSWGRDLEEQPSILGRLVGADDMAFAPAFREPWFQGETGTAIYARNGWSIEHAVNARLPDGERTQPRGMAVAKLVPPGDGRDGAEPVTVVGTHLAHGSFNDSARVDELAAIATAIDAIRTSGSFLYRPRTDGGWLDMARIASGFPTDRIVVGGDFNTSQDVVTAALGRTGVRHVRDSLLELGTQEGRDAAREMDVPTATRSRLDHVYAAGLLVAGGGTARVAGRELGGGRAPTDHAGVVADYAFDRAETGRA